MSATLKEIKKIVSDVLAEAKKKKEKSEELKYETRPAGYKYAESFDFSAPLGAYNLYRTQGAVNWGPQTGPGTKIDDRISVRRVEHEQALRGVVREAVRQVVSEDASPWAILDEAINPTPPQNVWEAANHWYDHQGIGLGRQTSEGIEEKKGNFAKLKNKLAHQKGVKNPAGLAASIGRTKYGKVGMAKKAAAGKK